MFFFSKKDDQERRIIEEQGYDVSRATLRFIVAIEAQAYPDSMQIMQGSRDMDDISYSYGYPVEQITIVRGRDWYLIYGEDDESIEILDIASSPTRDVERSRREMHDYLIGVVNKKAAAGNKPVVLSAKEDTSYKMIQRMVRNQEYDIIEDIASTWTYDDAIKMRELVLRPKKTEVEDSSKGSK